MRRDKNMIVCLTGEILLTMYIYFISYFYTLSVPLSWTTPLRLMLIYLAVHFLCKWIGNIRINILDAPMKMNWRFGLVIFGIAAGILGIYYIAFYPGGISVDNFNQWYQVQHGVYLDWHPVIHTLLFMKLPSLICNSLAFVNFLQLIWIGLACAYLGMVLERWGIRKSLCTAAVGLGIAVPSASIVLSFCWKDTALTIFMILLAGQITEIECSKGEWMKKPIHLILFALTGTMVGLMRHNGILLVGPLLLLLVIVYWKELRYHMIAAGVMTIVFTGMIKGPVYRAVEARSHPQVSAEMLGMPMTILANVLIHEPDKLDPDCREFLYEIGDQELWENTYREGSWNSAKWMGEDRSNDVIEEVGARNVLRYTWHAVRRSPYYSYRAVAKLFDVVWKPAGEKVVWSCRIVVHPNNGYGYETTGVPVLQQCLDQIYQWSVDGGVFLTWSWHIGFYILLMLFAGVSRLKEGFGKCLYWVPVMCYNFGTALLLCGADFRFFVFNVVITFPLLLMILGEKVNE